MNQNNGLPNSSNESILPFNPWVFGIQWVSVTILFQHLLQWFDRSIVFRLFGAAFCGSQPYILMLFILGILTGLVIGLMQWFLIYRHFNWSGKWVVATVVGTLISQFIYGFGSCSFSIIGTITFLIAFPIINGLIVGVSQWFVLRQTINWAGWWIIVNSLSEFIGSRISSIISSTNLIDWIESFFSPARITLWVIITSIEQALIVACLVWLFYRNIKQDIEAKTAESDDERLPPEASD